MHTWTQRAGASAQKHQKMLWGFSSRLRFAPEGAHRHLDQRQQCLPSISPTPVKEESGREVEMINTAMKQSRDLSGSILCAMPGRGWQGSGKLPGGMNEGEAKEKPQRARVKAPVLWSRCRGGDNSPFPPTQERGVSKSSYRAADLRTNKRQCFFHATHD